MSLIECLNSAVTQKAISRKEADALYRRFEEMRGDLRLNLGDDAAAAAAKDALVRTLAAEGIEKKRITALTVQVRDRTLADITGYRNSKGEADIMEGVLGLFEHFGFHGYSSVEGRMKSIVGGAQAAMEEALSTFDRTAVLGTRKNKVQLQSVVRELFGEDSKDVAAKRMADAFRDVAEGLRQRFNDGGGQIGKLEGWGLPQHHDPRAVISAKLEGWKDFIRPKLDISRMRDPLTGDPLSPRRLESLLDNAYERIITGGDIDLKPSMQPTGLPALRNQRQEHRFLHFNNADDWLAYAEAFGQGDPFAAMMNHVKGMARDIAALEILGPNPGAMVEFLKQTIRVERAKLAAGEPSLWKGGPADALNKAGVVDYKIDAVWNEVRGHEPVSSRMAHGFAAVRSTLTSALLGSASLTAMAGDPFIANAARRLAGLPTKNWLADVTRTFAFYYKGDSAAAVRSGLILEDAMHVMGQEARYAGSLAGPVWANWLADRTLTFSGLQPWTTARKHMFGMELQGHMADEIGKAFGDLDPRFRRMLEGYGFDERMWKLAQKAEIHDPTGAGRGVLRPVDMMAIDRAAGERWLEAIAGETERAVPTSSKRMRAYARAGTSPGTAVGEMVSSFMQFKAFGLSLTMAQIEAVAHETGSFGRAAGANYAGKLLLTLTLGGALAVQLRAMTQGKDPEPMDDPRFWLAALKTGGGFGLYGDFLFADVSRFGQDITTSLAGPTFGLINDVSKSTLGNVQKAIKGDDTSFARDSINLARRYTPVASSLFYTRAAWNRTFMDQLQYLADPEAHTRFRDMERKLVREREQEYWWKPGEALPGRPPDLTDLTPPPLR